MTSRRKPLSTRNRTVEATKRRSYRLLSHAGASAGSEAVVETGDVDQVHARIREVRDHFGLGGIS